MCSYNVFFFHIPRPVARELPSLDCPMGYTLPSFCGIYIRGQTMRFLQRQRPLRRRVVTEIILPPVCATTRTTGPSLRGSIAGLAVSGHALTQSTRTNAQRSGLLQTRATGLIHPNRTGHHHQVYARHHERGKRALWKVSPGSGGNDRVACHDRRPYTHRREDRGRR